jgi:glutamate dehydrogenase (NAD(P)+)
MLDAATVANVRCRVVAPGANAAVTREAETALQAAGALVVPDFVANAGGILASHFWPLELPSSALEALLERRYRAIVRGLLARATRDGVAPAELARRLAGERLVQLARDHRGAVRHERLIARLARIRRVVPDAAVTRAVAIVARRLGPALA